MRVASASEGSWDSNLCTVGISNLLESTDCAYNDVLARDALEREGLVWGSFFEPNAGGDGRACQASII